MTNPIQSKRQGFVPTRHTAGRVPPAETFDCPGGAKECSHGCSPPKADGTRGQRVPLWTPPRQGRKSTANAGSSVAVRRRPLRTAILVTLLTYPCHSIAEPAVVASLECGTVTKGGGVTANGSVGVIGQAVAGKMVSPSYTIDVGIVPCLGPVEAPPVGACPGGTADECGDVNNDGTTDDVCTWYACVANACAETTKLVPSDMGGQFGACAVDGFCNIHDANHALACFSGLNTCDAVNIDAGGGFGACPPDGFCNIHDANHALSCFSGLNSCSCPPSPAPEAGPNIVDQTDLTVVPVGSDFGPGDEFHVRVFLARPSPKRQRGTITPTGTDSQDSSGDRETPDAEPTVQHAWGSNPTGDSLSDTAVTLQSYQLHLAASGGKSGYLDLVDIVVEDRDDFAFVGSASGLFDAYNLEKSQMLAGLYNGSTTVPPSAYLATFTYRVSDDAAGEFVIDVLHDEAAGDQSFLIADFTDKVEITQTTPAVVTVTRELSQYRH